ncbi:MULTISPECIES: hypothetical protein [Segatella]|jgi:hypothetical protein|nr:MULTISPECIES: hypothetical protein [Segatella]UKK79204.1 hypothetical protein L6469_12630 [Segatella baroniae B14]SER01997.1 hypothetical protein SAMN05444375_12032 [Segatella baroniae B14]
MSTYEFITITIAVLSIIASAILTFFSIRSSNQSTKLLTRVMRENSRMTSSEHLSLYRIEAFYNAVAIRNLEFEIKVIQDKLQTTTNDHKELEIKLKQLQMNHQFMKIREMRLIQNDFSLQKELSELHKEVKV